MMQVYLALLEKVQPDGSMILTPEQTVLMLRWIRRICEISEEQHKLLVELQAKISALEEL